MSIPRVARIHLVYQFIILTLLVSAIGYHEILPDKKHLFILLVPVFCYQLIIVFYCAELLPIPGWMNWTEIPAISTSEQNNERDAPALNESEQNLKLRSLVKDLHSPSQQLSDAQTPRKEETNDNSVKDNIPSNDLNISHKVTKKASFMIKNNDHSSDEGIKVYFPHRQKRLEDWLEPKDNVRPYKVRNWKSVNCYQNPKPLPNSKLLDVKTDDIEIGENITSKQCDKSIESKEMEVKDLTKSYSFPFRHKKLEKCVEVDENSEIDFKIPIMPPWEALNYCTAAEREEKRRKSMSMETLDKELKLIKSHCQQSRNNDFTQSLELSGPIDKEEHAVKKNVLKSATSFNKLKQGIANCFNRNKKENFKDNDIKQNIECKKQFFKDLFLSKENLSQEKKYDFSVKSKK